MLRFLRLTDPIWLVVMFGAAVWVWAQSGSPPEPAPAPQRQFSRTVTGPPLEMAIARMGQDPAEVIEIEGR
jgi:hypothetical protein